jgi:hypothetical protein
MKPFSPKLRRMFTLSLVLALSSTVIGCREKTPQTPTVSAPAAKRTPQQAMQALLAVPEIAAWSKQIEQQSNGAAHGAVIQTDPQLTVIDGRRYYPLGFVENSDEQARRLGNFLVAETGDAILVEDGESGKVVTLAQWRAGNH